jgi:CheY-like chemotaxis protein
MDNHMPKMSGMEATKLIRALDDPLKADIPIIGLTADAFEESHKELRLSGMNEVLTKPLEEKVLSECLSRYSNSCKSTDSKDGARLSH